MQKLKRPTYTQLKEVMEEMYDHIHSQDQDIKYLSDERQYLSDYIEWKGLPITRDLVVNFFGSVSGKLFQ